MLFDLLTALLDSGSLWRAVAGPRGDAWRAAYLRSTYAEPVYRPYPDLVGEAAIETGIAASCADELLARYGQLAPWPEVGEVLAGLAEQVPLAIVTNCSEELGRIAAARIGIDFSVIVTAERAGFYKPHSQPYRLALAELGGLPAAECLFVAGSPYDLYGAAAVGLPVYWHDRAGIAAPPGAPPPIARHESLLQLPEFVIG